MPNVVGLTVAQAIKVLQSTTQPLHLTAEEIGATSTPAPSPAPSTPTSVQTGSVAPSSDADWLMLTGAGLGAAGVLIIGGGLVVNRRRRSH